MVRYLGQFKTLMVRKFLILVSGISNNKDNNNTNNSIGMNLLDDTWVNRKSSPDTSENFQLKIKEMNKNKSKTPNISRVQQFKQTTTYINNPQMQNSQFKNLYSQNDKSGKLLFRSGMGTNLNFNQNLIGKVTTSDGDEEYSNINEDIMNTAEKINKLQLNCVKSNNLREMDGKYSNSSNNFSNNNLINYSNYIYNNNTQNFNPINQSVLGYTSECNEEFNYQENFNNRDLSKKTLYPKFIEANNTLTRLSTEESNESFESAKNNNKFGHVYDDKYSYLTPVQNRVYPKTPMMNQQFPQGKQINFNNYNNNNSNGYYTQQRDPNFINNNTGMYMGGDFNQNRGVNLQNLPENAFSYNTDNFMNVNGFNMKSNSDKKKIKKSREEVDQTLFVINTKNIIEGKDIRTTIMIRHIPNKYTTQTLLEEINVYFSGKYDFFYLPMDYENQCNLGYAFINFVDHLYILYFYDVFKKRKWNNYKSHKECDLAYAKFQGQLELKSHLEKSCVMTKMGDDKKPVIMTPPKPLPKIEVSPEYAELFKSLYPHLVPKAVFLLK